MLNQIYLLQPPASDLISGGYLYNQKVGQHLTVSQKGCCIDVTPADLDNFLSKIDVKQSSCILIYDSLFLTQDLPDHVIHFFEHPRIRQMALIHSLPSQKPGMNDHVRHAQSKREVDWFSKLHGLIVTGKVLKKQIKRLYHNQNPEFPLGLQVIMPGIAKDALKAPITFSGMRPLVVAVGTLSPEKNQQELIQGLIGTQNLSYTVLLIGNKTICKNYANDLYKAIEQAHLKQHIQIMGQMEPAEVYQVLQSADLMVSPSKNESFGMAVSEGVMAGLPILAYDTGCFSSWIQNGVNGYLYPQHQPAAIYKKLTYLLTHIDILEKLHQNARNFSKIADFPKWEDTFARWDELLKTAWLQSDLPR